MTDPNNQTSVFLVEDDAELSGMMADFLSDEGFAPTCILDGAAVFEAVTANPPDIMVLDVMLPGVDGLEICRRLRKKYTFPILMLTAKDDDLVEVACLREGADNYLTKPVRPHVLLAHLNAMLRRDSSKTHDSITSREEHGIQGIELDRGSCRAFKNGQEISVSRNEFQVLACLFANAGSAVSRDALYHQLRGIDYDGLDRSVDLYVSALRRKLDDNTPPYKYIKTLRGQGYCLIKD